MSTSEEDQFEILENKEPEKESAWVDEDDAQPKVIRTQQYEEVWKHKEVKDELSEEDKELLKIDPNAPKTSTPHEIPMRRFDETVPLLRSHKGPVTTCQFHQTDNVLMTGGYDNLLHFYRMEGYKVNPILDARVPFRVETGRYLDDENVVALSGKHSFFTYNMRRDASTTFEKTFTPGQLITRLAVGNQYVAMLNDKQMTTPLLDKKSLQVVENLRSSTQFLSMAFHPTENVLVMTGSKASISVWDLRKMRCRAMLTDEGSINTMSVAFSPDGNYISCGSTGGIVNIYEWKDIEKSNTPTPFHSFNNLVYDCTHIVSTNSLLLMSTWKGENQLKLGNIQNKFTYSNFPGFAGLGKVQESTISPHSAYVASGRSGGRVALFRLLDYNNY
ncbi:hypothetical protein EIN_097700 [Entamoeba invadens IP1]|uniref:U3 small nucleolar RNA-associated protein n=1 Tax=Entamoeba invadens IP1 TaxID=370355 RepID=A0A0A1U450_ENTIV|nr:hypothetical protein EIN_097700 [Entamoeba invadens IP1]ELP87483.1 hypothetical protein EIN_097700 [Entamoeba invadens IP1]|eukprot:XP_004254254.1 hypothetical protein EIN_097700 [Entamoeba invadens IP1]